MQGVSSTQSKLALIKVHKKFKELDQKYSSILNGRKAELIAIVHDEIDALVPGECDFTIVPDTKLNEKKDVDYFYKPKTKFNEKLTEHAMAIDYSNTLKGCMQAGMADTFKLINSPIPALSSVASTIYWLH